nr:MAG TPA: tail protein [Caudoviricetes sp.]
MRDISDRFKNEQNNDNRNYLKYADITLTDGTVINLTNADFWSNGMKFEDSVSDDNTFNIGSANINTLNLSINNFDGKYTDYDFTDATVICYVGIELEPEDTSALLDTTGDKILDTTGNEIIVHKNALIEKIRICTMTVIDTPYQNTTIIELECEDNMRKFDRDYSASKLKYPATRKQIIQDACKVCGVTLDTLNFYQDSYQIPARPDDEALTFRQVIAWTCQIGCQYARCDKYGRLTIKWYDTEITDANRATIKSTNGFTPNLDDVVITGVQVTEYLESTSTDEEASSYLYGEEGYVLKISENKLIPQGTGEVVTNIIGEKCVGMSFRPFETECLTDIVLEAGDAVLITDRKGNKYKSYLTNVVLQPGAFEQISCNAESAARNSSKTYSLVTQAAVDARKSVWRERTTREQALQEFKDRLDNSTGVYTTVQTQQDGSQIFYLHDKPTLTESRAVWKMTAEAWGVSTDGGQTWNGGMTVDGDTIVRILNAVGVNADWINAGAITVTDTDGSIIFSVDMDTKSVYLDGSVQIGGGKSLNQTFANYLQESKDYSDGKLSDYAETVTGSLGELQDQIDGQIETFYYDYEPTLQNKPASDWTNATERKKHIGDLFFNKTTGYAYRFMQDGATWGWTLVQDTDITKAMKAAEDAQDTADHKRRVFVTKPQPPYDIGDLWSQGEGEGGDILTCTVSRAKGASYVQSDWQKLNKYTDDTKAEEALEAASLARNMTMQLDNDYQGIPVDSNGNYTEFPECTTTATVMYGTQDITDNCAYTITTSQNIQGNWDKETKTYTVTGLTADSGWVNIKAAYLNNLVVSKQFSLAKQYAGPQGIPGAVGTNGKTTYLHIQYAPVQNPTAAQMSKTPNKYIGTYTDFSGVDSTDPVKYTWAKFEGDQGAQGPKGADGIPGKDGKDGKTQYTHLAYANSADGQTDFSVSDGNREYIGMYVDFVEADSTDPTKYTWSLIKGANGAQGVPGTPGANGKTPYFHIAYANSADGRTGFSVDDSVNKLYIGQYTDYTPDDSTDPTKYSWTKIKGEQGNAGRTYFFQSNADVLLMGADKKITPAPLIVDSFYRDGNGEIAQSQKGWWKLEKSSDNGATWSTLTVSQTAALDRLNISVNNLSLKAHDMLKVSLYFDQSKSKLADYQTFSVAVDVASLTQEQIVDILSDDGKFKGLYYEKDESGNTTLYISFNAMKGGVISLGGTNNGNGQLKIYDADGNQISRLGYTGYVVLNKNTGNPMVSLNTAGLRLYMDYTDADNYNALMLGKYGLYAQKVQNKVLELWMEGTDHTWDGYIIRYLNNKVRINTNSLFTDGCELGANFSTGGNATVDGTLMFYDLENQAKTSGKVKRQPVASVSADDSQVAYLFSGTGSKHGDAATYRRLGIRAKWGGSGFSTDYLYTTSQVSDIRLKENIENSETDALETVNQMKVRQFDWKERMGGWHQNIGFVADELEEIDPNLALGGGYDENGEMDIKQINSPYLLNYAIKAIQELSVKVDEQEKRIKELERRLQDGKI